MGGQGLTQYRAVLRSSGWAPVKVAAGGRLLSNSAAALFIAIHSTARACVPSLNENSTDLASQPWHVRLLAWLAFTCSVESACARVRRV